MAFDPARVDDWIFDLDNTLYDPALRLFDRIDRRMEAFVAATLGCDVAEGRRVQKAYFHAHGTTLAGLMRHHAVDPAVFLADVHAIDLAGLDPVPALGATLALLPGRKLIFTNADAAHARRVLDALALGESFAAVHDIVACDYRPKPDAAAYASLCETLRIDPARAVFVEDMARNLAPAKAIGMQTVWIDNGSEAGDAAYDPAFVDVRVDALLPWLQGVATQLGGKETA